MVYGSKRYTRRFKRYNKLTKANIYLNRSARAQSKQIATLSRKVNYLAKNNKPEVLIKFVNFTHQFTNSALNTNFKYSTLSPWSNSFTGDDQAAGSVALEGNFVRMKNISVKCIAEYANDFTGDETDNNLSASYRILVVQEKIPTDNVTSYNVSDIFDVSNSTTSADTNVTMPLISGITSKFKILFSKTYTIHKFHPIRQHNIIIPAKKCLNGVRTVSTSGSSGSSSGRVYVFFLSGGLHYDTEHSSHIDINGTLKLAYTDN